MSVKSKPVYFVIPYRGSKIRNENLIEVLNYLNSIFKEINIIVGEHDTESRIDLSNYDNVQHFLIPCAEEELFDRTGTINFLIKKCPDGSIVVNNDSDCILSKNAYLKAFSMINSGTHDYVVPYSGRGYNVKNDFKFDREIKSGEYLRWSKAIGGVIVFDKGFYQSIGLENENIISWGYEDFERLWRVIKLTDYKRIVSPSPPNVKINLLNIDFYNEDLYHYDHDKHRDQNSNKNPHKENNEKVYEHVKKVPKDKLLAMIDSWEWKSLTERDNNYILLKHAKKVYDRFYHQTLDDIRKIDTYKRSENIYTAIDEYSKEIFKRGYDHYYKLEPNVTKKNKQSFSQNGVNNNVHPKYMTFVYTVADKTDNLEYSINSLVHDSDFFEYFDILIVEQNSSTNLNVDALDIECKDKIKHVRILEDTASIQGYHNYPRLMNYAVYNCNTDLISFVSSDHLFQPQFYYELNKTLNRINMKTHNLYVNSFDICKNEFDKHLMPRNYMKIYNTQNLKKAKGFNELMCGFTQYTHNNLTEKLKNNFKVETVYSMSENPKLFVMHNSMYIDKNKIFYQSNDKHNNIDLYNKKVSNFLYNVSTIRMRENVDYKKIK